MTEPKTLSDDELRWGCESWHPEDHVPGSLAYLCAVALENLDRTRKQSITTTDLDKARDKVVERAHDLVRLWKNGWATGTRPTMVEGFLRDAVDAFDAAKAEETPLEAPTVPVPVDDRRALNAFLDKAGYRRQGDLVFLTPVRPLCTREVRVSEKAAVAAIVMETHETLVFKPQGARLDRFRKNPVVLYNHDYEGLPVARSLWERVRDGDNGPELVAKPQFHMDTELSREVWRMLKEGKLTEWELGVLPETWEKRGEGFYVTKWDVLEYSLVPRPENMPALRFERWERRVSSPALLKSILKDDETDVGTHAG